ncbi:hypothetical protein [Rheinheimera texasensis]|uniref:hypothetical protein n=1 Tax=Rheinheimera texasensis TaxID=306205 RepID=UPI0032B23E35
MRALEKNFDFSEYEPLFGKIEKIAKRSRSDETVQKWQAFLKKKGSKKAKREVINKHFSQFVNSLSPAARTNVLRLKSDAEYEKSRVRISVRKETLETLIGYVDEKYRNGTWDQRLENIIDQLFLRDITDAEEE